MGQILSEPITHVENQEGSKGKLSYAAAAMQGWRCSMEDAFSIDLSFHLERSTTASSSSSEYMYFSLFDGHSGSHISKFCAENLPVMIQELTKDSNSSMESILSESFCRIDDAMKESKNRERLAELLEHAETEMRHTMRKKELRRNSIVLDTSKRRLSESSRFGSFSENSPPSKKSRPKSSQINSVDEAVMGRVRRRLSVVDESNTPTTTTIKVFQNGENLHAEEKDDIKSQCNENSSSPENAVDRSKRARSLTVHEEKLNTQVDMLHQFLKDRALRSSLTRIGNELTTKDKKTHPPTPRDNSVLSVDHVPSDRIVRVSPFGNSSKVIAQKEEKRDTPGKQSKAAQGGVVCGDTVSSSKRKIDRQVESLNRFLKQRSKRKRYDQTIQRRRNMSGGDEQSLAPVHSKRSFSSSTMDETNTTDPFSFGNQQNTAPERNELNNVPTENKKSSAFGNMSHIICGNKSPNGNAPPLQQLKRERIGSIHEEIPPHRIENERETLGPLSGKTSVLGSPLKKGGTTALVAVLNLTENTLFVANAGDSRCVMCRNGQAIDLSWDHKPTIPSESRRIIAAGGSVSEEGRINNTINLSRALGDFEFKQNNALPAEKQIVSPVPDVKRVVLDRSDSFIILACDGVWECLSSQTVVDFVAHYIREGFSNAYILKELFQLCLAQGKNGHQGSGLGLDNMTAIIVRLTG